MSKTHFYEAKPKYGNSNSNTSNHHQNNKGGRPYTNHKNFKKPYYTFDPIEKEETKTSTDDSTRGCPKFTNSKTTPNNGIKLKPAPEYKPKTPIETSPVDDFIITDLSEETPPAAPEMTSKTSSQTLPADKFSDELGGQTENSNAMNAQQVLVEVSNGSKKPSAPKTHPSKNGSSISKQATSKPSTTKVEKKKRTTAFTEEESALPKSTRFSRF